MERADKEFTVICDLSCHTLTYKGNPTAGGYAHKHTHAHAHSHQTDTVWCNSTLKMERWEEKMKAVECVCVCSL